MSAVSLFIYCPAQGFALSPEEVQEILFHAQVEKCFTHYVNLGRDLVEVEVVEGEVTLGGFAVSLEELKKVSMVEDVTQVFFLSREGLRKVAFYREGRFYKLRNVSGGAPTLEISGIHMHNVKGTEPWDDAKRKVEKLGIRKGDMVLDLCTGLGYTTSHALLRGATVVTIEKDPAALEVAEYNPWSRLLAHPNVTILLGDAFEVLDELPPRFFDAAIHDPPRFALAGELYSLEFYRKLHRVLKRGARVFHYTGWPGKHRGLNVQAGIAKRLRAAGFEILEVMKGYGILARTA